MDTVQPRQDKRAPLSVTDATLFAGVNVLTFSEMVSIVVQDVGVSSAGSESAAAEAPAATSAAEASAEPSSSPEEADVGAAMKAYTESVAAKDSGSEAQTENQAAPESKAEAAAAPEDATVPETLKMSTAGRKKEEEVRKHTCPICLIDPRTVAQGQ